MDLGFDDANEVGGWYELKPVVVVVMGTSSRRRERYMMSPGVLVSVFTSWYGTKVSVLVLVYSCCTVHTPDCTVLYTLELRSAVTVREVQ